MHHNSKPTGRGRPGRPPKKKRISVLMDADLFQDLTDLSWELNITRQDLIRRGLREYCRFTMEHIAAGVRMRQDVPQHTKRRRYPRRTHRG